eukprot:218808-Pelagomonas_calceolata.AAC.4
MCENVHAGAIGRPAKQSAYHVRPITASNTTKTCHGNQSAHTALEINKHTMCYCSRAIVAE